MAPTKAPMSAVAARKARQQAEAEAAAAGSAASTSRPSRRASSSRTKPGIEDIDDSDLQVLLPLPTASQAVNLQTDSRSSVAEPSSRRSRRLSQTAQQPDSVTDPRPRCRSSANGSRPSTDQLESKPKSAQAFGAGSSQTTPGRRSAKAATSSSSNPASFTKKRKSPSASTPDQDESDFDRGLQDIIDELGLGEAKPQHVSEHENSENERPPPKKRGRPAKNPTPVKSRTPAIVETESPTTKRTHPSKRPAASKAPAKQAVAEQATAQQLKRAGPPNEKAAVESSEDSTPSRRQSWLIAPDKKRRQAAMRYFASEEKAEKKKAKASAMVFSSMPVEDRDIGFLAFGDNDAESDQAADVDKRAEASESDGDAGDSSGQDDEDEVEHMTAYKQTRTVSPKAEQSSKATNRKKPSPTTSSSGNLAAHDGEEERALHTVVHGPRATEEALWDAIPYSRFECVLEGPAVNTIFRENKRKRNREALYFGLRCNETLVFLGVGHIQVLRGCAQIGGAVVSTSTDGPQAADIYAPICNALPVLKAVTAGQYPGHGDSSDVTSESVEGEDPDAEELLALSFDTIIKVTPLSSPITALGQVCPIGGLAAPFSLPPSLELRKGPQLSTIKILLAPLLGDLSNMKKNLAPDGLWATAGLSATYIPHQWQKVLHRLSLSALSAAQHPQEESVVALIRGSRKVGKSFLSRMALERLLSLGRAIGGKVAYLELDLGQSDFGPPGMVALHIFSLADTVLSPTHLGKDGEDEEVQLPTELLPGSQPVATCVKLGPGWCQPRVPARAHFLGDVSPRDDPESYVAAVHDLIEYFRLEVQHGQADASASDTRCRVPLVINTQGWVKGLGADLAARLETLLRPTHIFDVIPRNASEPVPAPTRGMPWLDVDGAILAGGPEIVTLESVSQLEFAQGTFGQREGNSKSSLVNGALTDPEDQGGPGDGGATPPRYISDVGSKLAPAEARLLNVMSYLYAHQLSPAGFGGSSAMRGTWDFSEPLVHRRPLVIDVHKGLKAGIRVLALGSSVTDSLKLMALNSSIVAIVVSDHDDQHDAGSEHVTSPWKLAFDRATQEAELGLSTRCIGLGIVRSIDVTSGQIHLLTPLDPAFVQVASSNKSIGLVKGALDLPVWASLDFEAIREARESRLDVPPGPVESESVNGQGSAVVQPLLAGMPRGKMPYLEWPHAASAPLRAGKGKREQLAGSGNVLTQLGADKRRVRRNLMRKSQFA